MPHIRNPVEWMVDEIKDAAHHVEAVGHSLQGAEASPDTPLPEVNRIAVGDLRDVLDKGLKDFAACRTDVVILCLLYRHRPGRVRIPI